MIPVHWTQNDLDINGTHLHYYRTGDGSKPALVLAHGFSDDGLCWLQTARDLEASYDIIMPDARGHGLSARIRPGENMDMAADLASIIQVLGLVRPIVGGHSMGATVAFQLGVRYPQIPRALILEDPPWWPVEQRPADGQAKQNPLAPWVETIARQTMEELVAQTRLEHPTWPEWVLETWCPAKKRLDMNILSVLYLAGHDWSETVPQLTCPTLIVTADPEKGGIVTAEIAARVQELNPLCVVAHIPGAGHHVRFGEYDAYLRVLRLFLEGK